MGWGVMYGHSARKPTGYRDRRRVGVSATCCHVGHLAARPERPAARGRGGGGGCTQAGVSKKDVDMFMKDADSDANGCVDYNEIAKALCSTSRWWPRCDVAHCRATCCGVSQRGAPCCNGLCCVATGHAVSQCVESCCNASSCLQWVVLCRSVLHCCRSFGTDFEAAAAANLGTAERALKRARTATASASERTHSDVPGRRSSGVLGILKDFFGSLLG